MDVGDALARVYAFRHLTPEARRLLADRCERRTFGAGEVVVRAGEAAGAWHLVLAGRARTAEGTGGRPRLYGPGDTFGVQSLIGAPASADGIQAEDALMLAVLTPRAFEAFAASIGDGHRAGLLRRLTRQPDFEFLRRLNVFAGLDVDATERLFDRLGHASVRRGDLLYRENAPTDACYIVRSGRLRLITTVQQVRRQLAMRREGDLVGEIELLYGTPRMADAIADTDCELFAFSRELFDELVPQDADRRALYELATERLLQYQNALSDEDTRAGQEVLPSLEVRWVPVPGQRYGSRCPFVPADSAVTAGVACLAMIDAAHGRDGGWQDRLEQLLWDREPDTLLTLTRKAELCGYLTHVVAAGPDAARRVDLPAVAEDADGSLAVVSRGPRGRLVVANPRSGVRTVDPRDAGPDWPGRLLVLSPVAADPRPGLLRGYAANLTGFAVTSLVTQALGIAGPLVGFWIIDRVLVDGDRTLLGLLLFGVLVMLCFHVAAGALREYLAAHTAGRVTLALELRFFNHILKLPPDAIAASRVGDLAVRFQENETFVREALKAGLFLLVDSASLAGHLVVLALLSPPLAGIALAFAALTAGLAVASTALARRAGGRHLDARRAAQSHLIEVLAGIHTVKALVLEPLFLARNARLMARRKAEEFREAGLRATLELTGRVLHSAAVAVIVAYGAVLVLRGDSTTGRLFAVMGIFGAMMVPLYGLLQARAALAQARGAWDNLAAVFSLETDDAGSTTVAPTLSGRVEFKHVSFRYPGALENALTDITLEVLPGQRVALVGRSGSGKTTLLNLLTGLYRATSGTIAVDEVDIGSIPKSALRRQLGVVEQHPFVFDGTIRENISRSDPAVPLDAVVAAARAAGADGFINALPDGYDTRIGSRGVALSGGERQRLVIARALVGNPRVLLLDEATSALDVRMERDVHRRIVERHGRRTAFIIAHRLSTVRDADLIVVLDQGRIVETGTHGELMARRGLYCYLNTGFV